MRVYGTVNTYCYSVQFSLRFSFFERCNVLLDFAVCIMMCISDNTGLSTNFNCCGHYHTTYQTVKLLAMGLVHQFFIPGDAVF